MFLANFLQVKKKQIWVYFQFKVKFKVKTVLNNITTLKRYFEATLNVFFLIFDGDKKKLYTIEFLCRIEI